MVNQSFETERLLIQPPTLEDASFFIGLFNTPKWLQYIGDRMVKSIGDAEAYITNPLHTQFERLGYGAYILVGKSDGVKIGIAGLFDREGLDGVDLGFALLPIYEKQGFATEASLRLIQAAFTDFTLDKLSAIASKNNLDSIQLLERLGFHYVGLIQITKSGEELLLYQLEK